MKKSEILFPITSFCTMSQFIFRENKLRVFLVLLLITFLSILKPKIKNKEESIKFTLKDIFYILCMLIIFGINIYEWIIYLR